MISVTIPDNIKPESKKEMIRLLEKTQEAMEEVTRHFSQIPFRPKEFKHRFVFDKAFSEGQEHFSRLIEFKEYLYVSIELLNGRKPHE
jgi:hypothetical protein